MRFVILLTLVSFLMVATGRRQTPRFQIDVGGQKCVKDFGEKVKNACSDWYTRVANYLSTPNYRDPASILIRFVPNYDGTAYVELDKNRITGATKYYCGNHHTNDVTYDKLVFRGLALCAILFEYFCDFFDSEHQDDVGSMIHEMTHIIQKYPSGCPGWFVEGLADYVRYFQYEPSKAPGKPGRNQRYQDGYGTTAYFLNYLSEKVNNGRQAVLSAHKGCREGAYKDSVWQEFTGKNLDTLWNDMQRS